MNATLWVIWPSMLVLCSTVAYSAGRHMFPSPSALDNAFEDGLARRDAEVADHLGRGFVLRARRDGSPVWVRERSDRWPGTTTASTSAENASIPPDSTADPSFTRAGCADAPDGSRTGSATGRTSGLASLSEPPDWREQVTSDLSALDVPQPAAGLGAASPSRDSGLGHPVVRTPWLRDRTAQAVAEWERFESELAVWAARMEEVIEG